MKGTSHRNTWAPEGPVCPTELTKEIPWSCCCCWERFRLRSDHTWAPSTRTYWICNWSALVFRDAEHWQYMSPGSAQQLQRQRVSHSPKTGCGWSAAFPIISRKDKNAPWSVLSCALPGELALIVYTRNNQDLPQKSARCDLLKWGNVRKG